MKHSNLQGVDHSKDNIYEAFTGKSGKLRVFVEKHLRDIMETAEISREENDYKPSISSVLLLIMSHPTLTDEEKILLAAEYGRTRGIVEGTDVVCSNCVVGPASKLIHSFVGNISDGKP